MLLLWIIIFCVSLFILIKAADYFTESAEKIGYMLKISPFIVGVTIISIGTSLPELATSIIAIIQNQTEIVVANAIGSNIANILLIVGLTALISGRLVVKRSLIDIDLPLLATATALIVIILWDKQVLFGEGIICILGYIVYAAYTIKEGREEKTKLEGIVPGEDIPATREKRHQSRKKRQDHTFKLIFILIFSSIFIYLGAEWTIKSIIEIATSIGIPTSLVVMSAMAIGTSLPELVVSIGAARRGKFEIALGNIFGSNIFNILVVIGIPSLFKTLVIDEITFMVGIPFVIGATVLYIFSGISKKIHNWEGMMYLLIYVLFLAKLFNLF
ncbi:calcium/sodium antiporter [bacterium]|jgi:cation:H+ antiporter|nr:calcium/sodium antiporter [bacterium]MBT4121687.1 calcium/sodium antiporter [bacterium]MBT4335341.1 calcium/sodium antiporter [bacterium]MBT4495917.1 calcium/sodium antiporter [bacterium]MBT4764297.1 calcium/sodium antiporter [bacterium]